MELTLMMKKTYSEMLTKQTFMERYEYLRLRGHIGETTFGFNRYLNQQFYTSPIWRSIRNQVIIRDEGCDLACRDREIVGRIYIHHINPISMEMFEWDDPLLYDLENLVSVSFDTHSAIHYGDSSLLIQDYIPRQPGDTKLW